jgi:hypothetical protein
LTDSSEASCEYSTATAGLRGIPDAGGVWLLPAFGLLLALSTISFAVLLWLIGTVFLVVALVTSPGLRVAAILYALSAPLFIWSG